jgi:hypothetical protein
VTMLAGGRVADVGHTGCVGQGAFLSRSGLGRLTGAGYRGPAAVPERQ